MSDTMNVRLEHPRGPSGALAPAIIKHAVRMCLRLRRRNIFPVDPPSIVDADARYIMIRAGKRVMILDSTGACRPCLRPVDGVLDPHALVAHYNRSHAMWINFAGEDRRRGWTNISRGHILIARGDRLILEEQSR